MCKPLPFLQGGELLRFFVELCILNRDRGLFGKGLEPVGMFSGEKIGLLAEKIDKSAHFSL